MNPFEYRQAEDVGVAVAAVAGHPNAVFLAAGTNLVDRMKLGLLSPELVVDVSRLPLDEVEQRPDGTVRVGANVRNSDLAAHPVIRRHYPALSQALLAGASGQLRNLATTGGNLLQRTRCAYFADPGLPCNKRDPGSGCPARSGHNRYHAILGASAECVAVHPSDLAVALAAYDASVVVHGLGGERVVPLVDLHRLPGDRPQQDTVLDRSDLITAVDLPAQPPGRRAAYRKIRDRASYAFALVSVAAVLDLADEPDEQGHPVVADVRIALGGVAHKPWRARAAEDLLRGTALTADHVRRAADQELAAAEMLGDNAFKVPLVRNTLTAVLTGLATREDPS